MTRIVKARLLLGVVFFAFAMAHGDALAASLLLAEHGTTRYVIVSQPDATLLERRAAIDLQHFLQEVTGARFPIVSGSDAPPRFAVVVGPRKGEQFAEGEVRIRSHGNMLFLAGAGAKGTLFAVYRFLQELGCRWWSPDADAIPRRPTLFLGPIDIDERPAFLSRHVSLASAYDPDWAMRNLVDAASYAGFAHTFYMLVPPKLYFQSHPEWFSLVSGKRRVAGLYASQLCLSNASLRTFVAERVKQELRSHPEAQIASVSQNDWGGFCECDRCQLLYRKYGSKSGALLEFVNAVAALVEPEFPNAVIDTLAYSETRRPPTGIRARSNVAVRFCPIEADGSAPLDSGRNAAILTDFMGWRKITERLHVWYYSANFSEYFLPHPNWFTLGSDMRFLHAQRVENVFLQGVASPPGGELGELRAWVLAQLTWDANRDERALIEEFVEGYYGKAAAKPILGYLDLMARAASTDFLPAGNASDRSKFLTLDTLWQAEQRWRQAEEATTDGESLRRIKHSHLSVRYAWLVRWTALQLEARQRGIRWPLSASRAEVANDWYRTITDDGASPQLANAMLEEYPGYLNASVFRRWLSVNPVASNPIVSRRRRLMPVVPMPAGFLVVSAAMIAIGSLLRRFAWPTITDRTLLLAAVLAILTAAVVLQMRGTFLMWRYAVLCLAASTGALVCSAIYVIRSAGRLRAPVRILIAVASVLVTAYCVWWSMPYGLVRTHRRNALSLPGARLAHSNLSTVIMQAANLRDADLRGAYMANAVLNYSTLDGADLRRVDLTGAQMFYTSCRDTDLRGADLRGARIHDLTHTAFRGSLYDEHTQFPPDLKPELWDMVRF